MTKQQQQLIAFGFGVVFVIVSLTLALWVPIPSSFQYNVFKTVLAIAIAGIGAMIPGFLEVTIPTWVRAGGALAIFIIVFFYNPATLVRPEAAVSSPPTIAPLVNPIDVTPTRSPSPHSFVQRSPYQVASVGVPLGTLFNGQEPFASISANSTGTPDPKVAVISVLQGENSGDGPRLYDVTISNPSRQLVILSTIRGRWLYRGGVLAGVEQAVPLTPNAKYIIDFPVDISATGWHTASVPVSPILPLAPAASPDNPTLAVIRLEVGYHLIGAHQYHPNADWNIKYDVSIITNLGEELPVIKSALWRGQKT
jgi:hypothetical protein